LVFEKKKPIIVEKSGEKSIFNLVFTT
jgi:hypothetical protein